MNTKFNVYIYVFLFPLLYYNYSFIYLYKGYASYIHISRGYVKHKRLRTTGLDYIASNGRIADELERIWKETVVANGPSKLRACSATQRLSQSRARVSIYRAVLSIMSVMDCSVTALELGLTNCGTQPILRGRGYLFFKMI
jgi:hypothetical protein